MEPAKGPLLADHNEADDRKLQETTTEPNEGTADPTAIRIRTEACQALFEACQHQFPPGEDVGAV
ncbi:hypothetical protein PG994_005195 [Apiospora phragmitis]|uniref:Uncharacterized protein n=1 Tax=Apiospora phragmitis TaxID=2905665 RepID=A0ABR1VSP5_9PEZI